MKAILGHSSIITSAASFSLVSEPRPMRVTAVAGPQLAERKPPAEVQLWSVGANATDYGVHVWSNRSVAEVLARYTERGNPLLVDVEHNGSTLKDGEPAVTAGYAKLEVRAGAPWLVFEWSDYGREQIESGQRRYLSPEYDVDKNTGEILALYRVSLVADPGTHRARMLASANTKERRPMDLSVILAALRAALAAEDPAVAKESISNLLAELGKSAGDASAPAEAGADAGKPAGDDAGIGMAAAAEEDKGEPDGDEKPAKVAAAAAPSVVEVSGAARAAVEQIKAAQRDHLLATQGDRLEPSIRRWASAQPLEVVKGLLDATPAKLEPVQRTTATRGATQGEPQRTPAEVAEAEEMDRAMGIRVHAYRAPYRRESDGAWVHPLNRPSDIRAHRTADAAKEA